MRYVAVTVIITKMKHVGYGLNGIFSQGIFSNFENIGFRYIAIQQYRHIIFGESKLSSYDRHSDVPTLDRRFSHCFSFNMPPSLPCSPQADETTGLHSALSQMLAPHRGHFAVPPGRAVPQFAQNFRIAGATNVGCDPID